MNIDKKLHKMIECGFCHGTGRLDSMAGASECNNCGGDGHSIDSLAGFTKEDVVSQIKQSILKAIMKRKPKESHINYHIEDGIEYRDQNDIPVSISWEKGYNRALEEFESVIKEVLK